MKKSIVIVGGGAAGYFSAINIAEKCPDYQVTILEKASRGLAKVKVSGGGRCNVTNERDKPAELVHFYPRGHKKLYPVFKSFTTSDMVEWLRKRGIQTHAEVDHRVFPVSNSSETIINFFISETYRLGIKVKFGTSVKALTRSGQQWTVQTEDQEVIADAVIVATGSSASALKVLTNLGLKQSHLVPSLFTFNIDDDRLKGLPGVSFDEVKVRVVKSKLTESGSMIITHWGLSGPAILKISSWGAVELQALHYQFQIQVNYVPDLNQEEVKEAITDLKSSNPKKKTYNSSPFDLPNRFWERLCQCSDISENHTNEDLSKKQINKLTEELAQGLYEVTGKSTFKEEFVTCGGIELSEINLETFECQNHPSLYLAGEVLNIDALTGGFNFQACWSAGWLISENV